MPIPGNCFVTIVHVFIISKIKYICTVLYIAYVNIHLHNTTTYGTSSSLVQVTHIFCNHYFSMVDNYVFAVNIHLKSKHIVNPCTSTEDRYAIHCIEILLQDVICYGTDAGEIIKQWILNLMLTDYRNETTWLPYVTDT